MKRWFVACIVLLGLAAPAHAQIPVTDLALSSITQTLGIQEIANQIKSATLELQTLQTEVQQYEQFLYIGQQLIHDPSLGAVMGLANQLGLSSSLPLNPYAVQSLLSGAGGINGVTGLLGKLGGLSGLVNTSFTGNQVYNCTQNTFGCQTAQMQSASIAGLNGISAKMLSDVADHMGVLQGLRTRLATASDPKTVQDVTAQLATEGAWISAEQTQMSAISSMAQAQQQAFDSAGVQKYQQDFATYAKQAAAYK